MVDMMNCMHVGFTKHEHARVYSISQLFCNEKFSCREKMVFALVYLFRFVTNFMGNPHDVVANGLDGNVEEKEFELQSQYYVHFRPNTHGKEMNPLIFPVLA